MFGFAVSAKGSSELINFWPKADFLRILLFMLIKKIPKTSLLLMALDSDLES